MVYVPIPQVPDKLMAVIRSFTPAYFTVRASAGAAGLQTAIKQEIAALDATLAVAQFSSMTAITAKSVAPQRFNMLLLGLFAALGLLLAAVGIYGVMSYAVAQRTHELGIRMALGAQRNDVLRLMLKHGLLLASLGAVLGIGGAFALTRVMESFLFGVTVTDPLVFGGMVLLLISVALVACYLPARRATKVDPLIALRYE